MANRGDAVPIVVAGIQPLVLAQEVQASVKEFLQTSFKPSTPLFKNLLTHFTSNQDNLFRGPYLSLDLPFHAHRGVQLFDDSYPIELGHNAYAHQQKAFQRLQSLQSTIVATGTGSGKTECFQLPVLDWCRHHSDRPGIKAVIIYPMNALAQDQAQRIASRIWNNPNLKGKIRVGLYIGDTENPKGTVMRESEVITNRQAMHRNPPDILLTNYKMLDNLLIYPDRKNLWEQNDPQTLRFLVVDELHTFDGAQGTDLACLIRRLKRRLQVPEGQLCCIGTSATLGEQGEASSILEYAEDLFAEKFVTDSVITEDRLSVAEFLGDPSEGEEERDTRFPSREIVRQWLTEGMAWEPEERINRLYKDWFGIEAPRQICGSAWRRKLGANLQKHELLLRLLNSLTYGIRSLDDLVAEYQPIFLAGYTRTEIRALIDGFVAMLAIARMDDRPFLIVRVHLWIRELKRMVVSLPAVLPGEYEDSEDSLDMPPEEGEIDPTVTDVPHLLFSDDQGIDPHAAALPVVSCRECGGMAWLTNDKVTGGKFTTELSEIYDSYFGRQSSSRLRYLCPEKPAEGVITTSDIVPMHVCRCCLNFIICENGAENEAPRDRCSDCGATDWTLVWQSTPKFMSGGVGDRSCRCAYCGSATGTGIFGVAATSMSSFVVSRLFASKENVDPKLLGFTDAVQDAAHKAGFIEARSYRTVLRQAIAHWLAQQRAPVSYAYLHSHLAEDLSLLAYSNSNVPSPEESTKKFLATLTHPDLLWYQGIRSLREKGIWPDPLESDEHKRQDLIGVSARLSWEVFSELTFRSQFGRTLENTGCVSLFVNQLSLREVAEEIHLEWHEHLRDLFNVPASRDILHFILGILYRMLHDGSIRIDPEKADPIGRWARSRGSWFAVALNRSGHYPRYGRIARKPLLPSVLKGDQYSTLFDAGTSARWYPVWARKCLSGARDLKGDSMARLLSTVFDAFTKYGLTEELRERSWALRADQVFVSLDVVPVRCRACHRMYQQHRLWANLWEGMKCLNPSCRHGTLQVLPEGQESPLLRQHLLHGSLRRVNANDHSGMLVAKRRQDIENRFKSGHQPWDPNLLSTTPTLELGVDIGDLSSVLLYGVPPSAANYLQRTGRAGRRTGNSLGLTMVNGESHDLYFWANPPEMIQGNVEVPGLYLQAFSILRRQFNAFSLEQFLTDQGLSERYGSIGEVTQVVAKGKAEEFPLTWLRFVVKEGAFLVGEFCALFADVETQALSNRLLRYTREEEDSLHSDVRACIYEAHQELLQWQRRIRELDKRIKELEETMPPPKELAAQLRPLRGQRATFQRTLREARRKSVLNQFTERGVLPNYAFPDEGIKLHSAIFRGSSEDEGLGGWADYEYTRPSGSALSEFAPGASFYAEGYRIRIEEVDMRMSKLQKWRFCPECSHMEIIVPSGLTVGPCPECESPKWADIGQQQDMVALKQVHAHARDSMARIQDDQEERSVVPYVRNMVATSLLEPDSSHLSESRVFHSMSTLSQPFGFEFVPHMQFRDMNLGCKDMEEGLAFTQGGMEHRVSGFQICQECGRQLDPKKVTGWQDQHGFSCKARRSKDSQEYLITTFLYREFQSEAVRVRVPTLGIDDVQILSFKSALHLGMRIHFKGQVDHLSSIVSERKGPRSSAQDLLIYDTVPGGTGYLEELANPDTFKRVLELAFETLENCPCQSQIDQMDGCYQCLRRYGDRRDSKEISRLAALGLLTEMLNSWKDLARAEETERKTFGEELEESELEKRFVRWLKAKVEQEHGTLISIASSSQRTGYKFTVNGRQWEVYNQYMLGSGQSVAEMSKADFMIQQSLTRYGEAPPQKIIVFTDGWKFHKNRLHKDIAQRLDIHRNPEFLVWSLTWEDLDQATMPSRSGDAWNPLAKLGDLGNLVQARNAPDRDTQQIMVQMQRANSADLLYSYLEDPDSQRWVRSAAWLASMVLRDARVTGDSLMKAFESLPPVAREYQRSFKLGDPLGHLSDGGSFLAMGGDVNDLKQSKNERLRPFIYLDQDASNSQFHFHWRGALHLFNAMQFLPNCYWLTAGDGNPLHYELAEVADMLPSSVRDIKAEWDEQLGYAIDVVHPLISQLRQVPRMPVPEVGTDLTFNGFVAANAELVWQDQQVAIVSEPLNEAQREQLVESGWLVYTIVEAAENLPVVQARLQQE